METIARTSDVIEKLILIKYELDKNIMILCRVNNIQTYQRTIIEMINDLSNKKIVDEKAINLLLEIIPELDRFSRVKSKKVDMADAQWVADVGSALVMHLEIISKKPSACSLIDFDQYIK